MFPKNGAARILCLGAGALQRHHFESIRALGHRVIAMDRNPEAPARHVADHFVSADPGDTETVMKIAREQKADAILPLGEFGVLPAAVASNKLGFGRVEPEAARNATDKALMRQAWAKAGIDQPRFAVVRTSDEAARAARTIGFPLIVKPRSLTAARGVRRIDTPAQLQDYFGTADRVSKTGFVIEEFIDGIETSVEGIVVDGRAIVLAYADKELRPHLQHRVTRSINYPGRFAAAQAGAIARCAQRCVPALGLENSPFHFEVFVLGDRVVPIECAARGGGGHIYGPIVELVSGVDLVQAAVRLALGERIDVDPPAHPRGACYRFLFAPAGQFASVNSADVVASDSRIVDIVIAVRAGQELGEPASGIERHGFMVTKGRDREDAYDAANGAEGRLSWLMT
jgi:biotin carboxylase